MLGPDEDVFEVEPGLAAERRKRREPESEADRLAVHLGDGRFGRGMRAEQVPAEVVGRRLRVLLQLLIDRQLADQVHEQLRIVGPGQPDRDSCRSGRVRSRNGLGPLSSLILAHEFGPDCIVGEPEIDAQAVRGQPFLVGQQPDIRAQSGQAVARERDQARPLEEVVGREPRGPRAVPPVGSTCDGPAA